MSDKTPSRKLPGDARTIARCRQPACARWWQTRQPARSRLDYWKKRNGWNGLLLITTALSFAGRPLHYLARARAVVNLHKNARLLAGSPALGARDPKEGLRDVEQSHSRRDRPI